MSDSAVDHPKHYNFGKFEVIDVIVDWALGFCLGNTVKYIARAGKKGDKVEDLKKARWYLDFEIRSLTGEPPPDTSPVEAEELTQEVEAAKKLMEAIRHLGFDVNRIEDSVSALTKEREAANALRSALIKRLEIHKDASDASIALGFSHRMEDLSYFRRLMHQVMLFANEPEQKGLVEYLKEQENNMRNHGAEITS